MKTLFILCVLMVFTSCGGDKSSLSVNDLSFASQSNASSYKVSGNCAGSSGNVKITIGAPNIVKSVACTGGKYLTTLDVSLIVSNPMTVLVEQDGKTAKPSTPPINDQIGPISAPRATPPSTYVRGSFYNLPILCNEAQEIVSISGSGLNPSTQTHTCTSSGEEDFRLSLESFVETTNPNNLRILSTDKYKNPSSGEETISFLIDNKGPRVEILNEGTIIQGQRASFTITVTDINISEFNYSVSASGVDSTPYPCSENPCEIITEEISSSGVLTLTVEANSIEDAIGNRGDSVLKSSSLMVEEAGTLRFASLQRVNSENAGSYTVSGACAEGSGNVTIRVNPSVSKSVSCNAPGEFSGVLDVSGVSLNPLPVSIIQSGNTIDASPGPVNDQSPIARAPEVEDQDLTNGLNFMISVPCNEINEVVTFRNKGLSPNPQHHTCTTVGPENVGLTFIEGVEIVGTNTVTVSSIDENENPTTNDTEFNLPIDNLAPRITILAGTNSVVGGEALFRIRVADTNRIESFTPTPSSGVVSSSECFEFCDVTVTGASVGRLTLTVGIGDVVDNAGNGNTLAVSSSLIVRDTNTSCPENYVPVPALAGYTSSDFCVMKYEAKYDDSDNAVSKASGLPVGGITRGDAITKCQGIGEGYDLMTNDEWQTIARNIESVDSNWSVLSGIAALSLGFSQALANDPVEASENDNEGCHGAVVDCDSFWDLNKRIHALSNGEVVWDISGNVSEWVKDDKEGSYGNTTVSIYKLTRESNPNELSLSGGTTTTPRVAKDQFGPDKDYGHLNRFSGLGQGFFTRSSSFEGILRGCSTSHADLHCGVFYVSFANPLVEGINVGFRCVYHPSTN